MAGGCLGIDIGASSIKLAEYTKGGIFRFYSENMPENMVNEGRVLSLEAMSTFIRETVKKSGISEKKCAVILPEPLVFTRRLTLPYMNNDQLMVNLPYEFRDFISEDKSKYVYDYAAIDITESEDGKKEIDLMAAAALKSTVSDYSSMLKRAGLKLAVAIPSAMTYMNLIYRLEDKLSKKDDESGGKREYCFIDLGHTNTRIHIFDGHKLSATRSLDYGLNLLDAAIADAENVDVHIAKSYKESDYNGILESETCKNIYSSIAVEVMRAINFYRFNNQESPLSSAYICGGGGRIKPLTDAIAENTELELHAANDILSYAGGIEGDGELFAGAAGAAVQ